MTNGIYSNAALVVFDLKVVAFGVLVFIASVWIDRWRERRMIAKEIARLIWIDVRRMSIPTWLPQSPPPGKSPLGL